MRVFKLLPLIVAFAKAAPAVLDRSLAAADIDEMRAGGMTERAILETLKVPHPTPSLPFRVVDEKDDLAPTYEMGFTDNGPETADSNRFGVIGRMGSWLLHVLMEMDGRIEDGYEGMQEKMTDRPPQWRFRWDAMGRRLPPEVRSEI